MMLPKITCNVEAINSWKHNIQNNSVKLGIIKDRQCRFAICSNLGFVTLCLQIELKPIGNVVFVLYY